jgi:UDP-N-acetylmuramate dehydrogenase
MLFSPKENEALARHTSWRIGGPARYYAEITSVELLQAGLAWAHARQLPVFLLGGGTNLLARDEGFPGLVLRYVAKQWRIENEELRTSNDPNSQLSTLNSQFATLYVEAGAPMAGTVRRVAALGWGGLAWAEGLPGSVGGAVFGNAGCYGGDIASVLQRAWLFINGTVEEWPVEKFEYGYRTSILKNQEPSLPRAQTRGTENLSAADAGRFLVPGSRFSVVLAAELRLHRADPAELAATMASIAAERKGKTPWGSSCGSVFKNPPGQSAGRLIEQAGLKGTRIGGAEISERHGNYIVNLGGASSNDILALVERAQAEVQRQFGIELELEVQIL